MIKINEKECRAITIERVDNDRVKIKIVDFNDTSCYYATPQEAVKLGLELYTWGKSELDTRRLING